MGRMPPQTTQRQFPAAGALHQSYKTTTASLDHAGEDAPIAAEGWIFLVTNPRSLKALSTAGDQAHQQAGKETAQPRHR